MNREINYKKFENKLKIIYPHISDKKANLIIKQLFKFRWDIIENIDKLEFNKKKDINETYLI
jgi:hypothetical protein